MKEAFRKRGRVFAFLKVIVSLPAAIKRAVAHWWRFGPMDPREAERVDRICNPSRYLGKD